MKIMKENISEDLPWYILEKYIPPGESPPIPLRVAVLLIAIIILISSSIDIIQRDKMKSKFWLAQNVESIKVVLMMVNQIANTVFLIATIVEQSFLLQTYELCALSSVVLGLMVSLLDFLLRTQREGIDRACATFVPDVVLYFAIFRCLPLVDEYAKDINFN